jgi:hypothetical protein
MSINFFQKLTILGSFTLFYQKIGIVLLKNISSFKYPSMLLISFILVNYI